MSRFRTKQSNGEYFEIILKLGQKAGKVVAHFKIIHANSIMQSRDNCLLPGLLGLAQDLRRMTLIYSVRLD